ncbi:hypothetical protein M0Q50_03790 [bacterium]|nr:hypothetical protein [bacterium]
MKFDKKFKEHLYEISKKEMMSYDNGTFEIFFDDENERIDAHWTEYINSQSFINTKVFEYKYYEEYIILIRKKKINSLY